MHLQSLGRLKKLDQIGTPRIFTKYFLLQYLTRLGHSTIKYLTTLSLPSFEIVVSVLQWCIKQVDTTWEQAKLFT